MKTCISADRSWKAILWANSIQSPDHRSWFALEDGRALDGPGDTPTTRARVRNGQIEVRKPLSKRTLPMPDGQNPEAIGICIKGTRK